MDYIANIRVKSGYPIQSFGGLNFFFSDPLFASIAKSLDSVLGARERQGVVYRHSDILGALMYSVLCGGSCIEDVNRCRSEIRRIPGKSRIPSSDTTLRYLEELSAENSDFSHPASQISYNFNINSKLNNLLMQSVLRCFDLRKDGEWVDFDYDNVLIKTEKQDAKYTFEECRGYFPGVAFVNGHPFYIENRDGNAPPTYRQADTLKRAFELLERHGLRVRNAVMDCGSYTKKILKEVSKHASRVFIRAANTDYYRSLANESTAGWHPVRLEGGRRLESRRVVFDNFPGFSEKGYEIVLYLQIDSSYDGTLFEKKQYKCFVILTNAKELSDKEVIKTYNARGAVERNFDQLKNDFNWSRLPSSEMKSNTVFMILIAILRNLYTAFVEGLSRITSLPRMSRLKAFIYNFVTCPAQWVREKSGWYLDLYSPPDVLLQYVRRRKVRV